MLENIYRFTISAGLIYILAEMSYWAIRFWRDWQISRATVAQALFFLMTSFGAHMGWLVVGLVLNALLPEDKPAWINPLLIAGIISVAGMIMATYYLRCAFKDDIDAQEADPG